MTSFECFRFGLSPKVTTEYLDTVKLNMDFMVKLFKSARQRVYEYCLENGGTDRLGASIEMGDDPNSNEMNQSKDGMMDIDDDEEYIALKRELEQRQKVKEQLVAENEGLDSKLMAVRGEKENYDRFLDEMKLKMVKLEKTKVLRTPLEEAVWKEFLTNYHKTRGYMRGVCQFNKSLKATDEAMNKQRTESKAES